MVVRRKHIKAGVDSSKSTLVPQQAVVNAAMKNVGDVKSTEISKLNSIRTEVTYFEQEISDRQGNLANTSSFNKFDPNLGIFRKISNFVLMTKELDMEIEGELFDDLTHNGEATVLPNTIIPNINDYFIMNVLGVYNVYRVTKVNSTTLEKDSGYQIEFILHVNDINVNTYEFDGTISNKYTFDYNHIGTEFRTIFKDEEFEFLNSSREVMKQLLAKYKNTFYNKTLNTLFCNTFGLSNDNYNKIISRYGNSSVLVIGGSLDKTEKFDVYDDHLVKFINKFDLFGPLDDIVVLDDYLKRSKSYNNSIFGLLERRKLNRYTNIHQLISYVNSNSYTNCDMLYGRVVADHFHMHCDKPDGFTLSLLPDGFIEKITTYDEISVRDDTFLHNSITDIIALICAVFINEDEDSEDRLKYIVKLLGIIVDEYFEYVDENEFDNYSDMFYTYPILVYILKYCSREISMMEFK